MVVNVMTRMSGSIGLNMTDMKVQLEDGKYELTYKKQTGDLIVVRNGKFLDNYMGNELMYLLVAKITELQEENTNIRRANLDCMEHFNELMKDYNELQKELSEIEEREYNKQLIESR